MHATMHTISDFRLWLVGTTAHKPADCTAEAVEARKAENGGRRPILWQRPSGQEALRPVCL